LWKELSRNTSFEETAKALTELKGCKSCDAGEFRDYFRGLMKVYTEYWRWQSSSTRLSAKFRFYTE